MTGMGDEIHDTWDCEIHRAGIQAMRQRAAELRAELCASRGLTPAQACGAGCRTCGVIDASPARCEQCTGVHAAGRHPLAGALDAAMAALDAPASPLLRDLGAALVQHLPAKDTEGGAA